MVLLHLLPMSGSNFIILQESDIDLTGWTINAVDGTPSIALSGTITAGGYYLLERTDDTTISDITADLIYTGALSNTVEESRTYEIMVMCLLIQQIRVVVVGLLEALPDL